MNTLEISECNFDETVLKSHIPTAVDFWAPWCGPCKQLSSTIRDLEIEYVNKVKFVKVNIDECEDLAIEYSIRSVPTIIFFNNGKIVDRLTGNQSKASIENKIQTLI